MLFYHFSFSLKQLREAGIFCFLIYTVLETTSELFLTEQEPEKISLAFVLEQASFW